MVGARWGGDMTFRAPIGFMNPPKKPVISLQGVGYLFDSPMWSR